MTEAKKIREYKHPLWGAIPNANIKTAQRPEHMEAVRLWLICAIVQERAGRSHTKRALSRTVHAINWRLDSFETIHFPPLESFFYQI